ncbi:MAG TPA: hypothetical protein VEX43_17055, partial [Chthoniobacterales bacterium]|nr:hypothetical protein [Chthoniobacterales bacterium]
MDFDEVRSASLAGRDATDDKNPVPWLDEPALKQSSFGLFHQCFKRLRDTRDEKRLDAPKKIQRMINSGIRGDGEER